MIAADVHPDVDKWLERVMQNPAAVDQLLTRFDPFGDQVLLDLFRRAKVSLVDAVEGHWP